jgi:hypothetical protein
MALGKEDGGPPATAQDCQGQPGRQAAPRPDGLYSEITIYINLPPQSLSLACDPQGFYG